MTSSEHLAVQPKIQIISSVQMHPPMPVERKVLKRHVAHAPPSLVPLYSGSNTYISTTDLVKIYTSKAALYTARLIDVIFGRETLMNACVNRTENSGDLVPLDKEKLNSVIGKSGEIQSIALVVRY